MIHGGRSLLQAAVARAARWSSPERTVVVVAAEREELAHAQLREYGPVDIVAQPSNRGTAPGVWLPLTRIVARDPSAHVVILPSDHYIRDEEPFERSIRRAIAASQDHIALVGAVPSHPETQYGWIVPGGGYGSQRGVVDRFYEKPTADVAERLWRRGALWNTFVMAGAAQEFWALGSELLPSQVALFDAYREAVGTPAEERVLTEIYACMKVADFSSDVLQKASGLRVVPLHDCGWSDWGTPERVLESLRDHRDFSVLERCLALA
jgi:mannose-1-phosphate guanylyltransferase